MKVFGQHLDEIGRRLRQSFELGFPGRRQGAQLVDKDGQVGQFICQLVEEWLQQLGDLFGQTLGVDEHEQARLDSQNVVVVQIGVVVTHDPVHNDVGNLKTISCLKTGLFRLS